MAEGQVEQTVLLSRESEETSYGMNVSNSLVVTCVSEGGVAEAAELPVGAQVIAINGTRVTTIEDAITAIKNSGTSCSITYTNGGRVDPKRSSKVSSPLGGIKLSGLKRAGGLLNSAFNSTAAAAETLLMSASAPVPTMSLLNPVPQDDGTIVVSHDALTKLRKELDVGKRQTQESQARHARNLEETRSLKKAIESTQAQTEALSAEYHTLMDCLNRSKAADQRDALAAQVRNAEEEKERDLAEFMGRQASLKSELKQLKAVHARVLELKEEAGPAAGGDAYEEEVSDAEHTRRLAQHIQGARDTIKRLEAEAVNLDQKAASIEEAFEATMSGLADQDALLFNYTNEIEQLRVENDQSRAEREKLTKQIHEGNERLEDVKRQLMEEIRAASNKKDADLAKASERLLKIQEEENQQYQKLQDKEAALDGLKRANRTLQQSSSDMKLKEPDLLSQISELQKEVSELDDIMLSCSAVEQERDEKKAALELCQAQARELEKDNAVLAQEVEHLKKTVDDESRQLAEAEADTQGLEEKIEKLQEEIDELQPLGDAKRELELQLEDARRTREVEIAVNFDLLDSLDEHEERQLAAAKLHEELTAEIATIEEQTARLHDEAEQHTAVFQSLVQAQQKEILERRTKLKDDTSSLQKSIAHLQRQLRATEGKFKDSTERLCRLEAKLRGPTAETGDLLGKLKGDSEQLMLAVSAMQERFRQAELGKKQAQETLKASEIEIAKKDAALAKCAALDAADRDKSPKRFLAKLKRKPVGTAFTLHVVEELLYENTVLKNENSQLQARLVSLENG